MQSFLASNFKPQISPIDAAIHSDAKSGARGARIDTAILQPQRLHARGDTVLDNCLHALCSAKHVDHIDGFRNALKSGIARCPSTLSIPEYTGMMRQPKRCKLRAT
jgi:hypothetical protein